MYSPMTKTMGGRPMVSYNGTDEPGEIVFDGKIYTWYYGNEYMYSIKNPLPDETPAMVETRLRRVNISYAGMHMEYCGFDMDKCKKDASCRADHKMNVEILLPSLVDVLALMDELATDNIKWHPYKDFVSMYKALGADTRRIHDYLHAGNVTMATAIAQRWCGKSKEVMQAAENYIKSLE